MEVAEVISTVDNIFENYVPKLTTLNYSNDQIWEVLKTAGINEVKHFSRSNNILMLKLNLL